MNEKKTEVSRLESYMDKEIKKKVLEVLDSGQYILGKNCKEFEEKFFKFAGRKYGVLSNSATSVIQLTLIALGIGKGDEVIVPSLTAFPTIEPIIHVGAKPIFVDVGGDCLIDANKIEKKITIMTKAIMPVHLYGNVCEMDKIMKIAKKYNIMVLEDSCQAHGSEYKGRKVGGFGVASFFSFFPSKNMTFCGDGGIMVTNNKKLADKVRMLRNHGRKQKYVHKLVGFNMRNNEIQAGVGLVQLKHLSGFVKRRREIAKLYNKLLKDLPIKLPQEKKHTKHSYHLYVIQTENRDKIMKHLKKKNIWCGLHYPIPCHLQPAVTNLFGKVSLPKTEELCKKVLSLPIFPKMTDEQVKYVAKQVREALR